MIPNLRGTLRAAEVWVDRFSLPLLRYALVVVFAWTGILTLVGSYPVAGLIAESFPVSNDAFRFAFGTAKLAISGGLLFPSLIELALWVVVGHTVVVTVPLITLSAITFLRFPYAPSFEGVYIIKDWVLLSGVVVLADALARSDEETDASAGSDDEASPSTTE